MGYSEDIMFHPASITLRQIVLAALMLAVIGTQHTFAQSDADLDKTRERAFKLIKEQKFVDALPLLERLSIERPDDAQVFFYLGFALMGKANISKDEDEKKALRIRSRKAFVRSKELNVQEPVVDSMIASIPADGTTGGAASPSTEAEKFLKEGEAFYSQGKHDDALRSYEKALKADPKLYEAALFSGDVHVVRNKFDRAEESYQRAIAINPDRETAYRYSATPLMKQKKYDEARDRYIEAFITEPYNSFASGGLEQWARITDTSIGHPQIDIPDKIEVDSSGNVKVELPPEVMLGGRENGTYYWTLYGPARTKWRRDGFARAYPKETSYRHSLAEEADALRAVLTGVKADKGIKKLDPSLEKLIKLDEQGLLESYILLARPDDGIAADHPVYLKQNREKLRRYVKEHVIGGKEVAAATNGTSPRESGVSKVVNRSYDADEDKTSVKITFAPITCIREGCVFYTLETSFPGRTAPAKSERNLFALVIVTKALKPSGDAPFSFDVDGKTYNVGGMQFLGEESMEGLRALIFAVPLADAELGAIANGKRVEMNLGGIKIPVPAPAIKDIAAFYAAARSGQ